MATMMGGRERPSSENYVTLRRRSEQLSIMLLDIDPITPETVKAAIFLITPNPPRGNDSLGFRIPKLC